MNRERTMDLVIIAAVADNGVIGHNGELPWHYPQDLKHFRAETIGSPVIMGRKTFESIEKRLGQPLPERKNIVLTRNGVSSDQERVIEVGSIDEALEEAKNESKEQAYVIGGRSTYEEFLNRGIVDYLLITHIPRKYNGDTQWPGPDFSELDCIDCRNISEALVVSKYRINP
ncbi:dihydrofolate reductase [Haloarcula japonica DSM 6131]|uniref:dihydrofolate reductase n=4 Tax=Haloarcula TaxID=2237 RepID=A0A830EP55_9EURY|nr:dihydrofolate reductase [Haloarcula japonica DSM 6131]GGK79753.1 dihydrofolate reductase [Haloarcula sebkhae]